MSYTIANLKDSISRKLSGRSVARLGDFYAITHEAGLLFSSVVDALGTIKTVELEASPGDNLREYIKPADMKGIIDVRPIVGRLSGAEYMSEHRMTSARELSQRGNYDYPIVAERYRNGVSLIELGQYPADTVKTVVSDCEDTTEWALSPAVNTAGTAIDTELTLQKEGDGALRISASYSVGVSVAAVDLTLTTALDLTDVSDRRDPLFFRVRFADGFRPTGNVVTVRFGSTLGTDEYISTAVAPYPNNTVEDGWQWYKLDWKDMSVVGTPTLTAIDQFRFQFNYTGTITAEIMLDDIAFHSGSGTEIDYYSSYLFRNSAGTWIDVPTADGDEIILDSDALVIFQDFVLLVAIQNVRSLGGLYKQIAERLGYPDPNGRANGSVQAYMRRNPSEALRATTINYDFSV
jgi:hypothetical protein